MKLVLILVCPPGLEPGPGASEALMVSNSTTGTFCIFMRYFQKFSKIYTKNKIEISENSSLAIFCRRVSFCLSERKKSVNFHFG